MAKESPGLWSAAEILRIGSPAPIDTNTQRQILNDALANYLLKVNVRIVTVSSEGVQVQYTPTVNHAAHFVITLMTVGLWAIGWFFAIVTNKPVNVLVRVDAYGAVVVVPKTGK